ncbi:helix-turn-helix domain-containing protein [Kineococcus sp. SYSU DK006]|uniref:helix-turn-helix domain-containing protein n=1 Tax=Kineococcus sp. SYSU DK006 TaxID=3383127 RepID=UPI003D7D93FE
MRIEDGEAAGGALDMMATKVGREDVVVARLRHAIESNGWTQRQVQQMVEAQGVPFPQTAVSKLLRSRQRRAISVDEALAIARALDMSLAELLLPEDALAAEATLRALREASHLYSEQERARNAWEAARALIVQFLDGSDGDLQPGWQEVRENVREQLENARHVAETHRAGMAGWMGDVLAAMEGER